MERRRTTRVAALALVLLLATIGLAAEAAPAGEAEELRTGYAPPRAGGSPLSVDEAVRLALANDPRVYLAREKSQAAAGAAQQSSGAFDSAITLSASFEHGMGLLIGAGRNSEVGKRNLFRILSERFDDVAADLEQQLQEGQGTPYANCPEGVDIVIGRQSICISQRTQNNYDFFDTILDAAINAVSDPTGLISIRDALEDRRRTEIGNIIDILHLNAFALRRQLRDMGTVPEVEEKTTLTFDLRLSKPFRSGVVFGPGVIFEYLRDTFDGKPSDPRYGGRAIPDKFTSIVGFTVDVPLGKGRGTVSAAAPERSAQVNHEASLETEANTLSQSVLSALLAYWDVVAAQEQLKYLEESAATEGKLQEMGEALAEAEEIAPADLAHIHARVADSRSSVLEARLGLLSARLALADALGLEVERVEDAPLAADSFPTAPALDLVREWRRSHLARIGVGNRADVLAARKLQESARILSEAAKADLKPSVDLSFTFGYAGLSEGWSFMKGLDGAFLDPYTGPSAILKLTVDLPFANNVALGRLAQARATERRSQVNARDLERKVSANVESLVGSIEDSVKTIERLEASAAFYRQTLADEVEKFKLGEGTAIDVILTEERQTSTLLSLVTARQNYASLLAQLRYELGVLVSTHSSDQGVVVDGVSPLGFDLGGTPAA